MCVEMAGQMDAEKFRAGILAAASAAGSSSDVDRLIAEAAYVLVTPDVRAGKLLNMLQVACRLLRASIAAGSPDAQQAPLVTLVECLHAAVLRPEAPALHFTGKRGAVMRCKELVLLFVETMQEEGRLPCLRGLVSLFAAAVMLDMLDTRSCAVMTRAELSPVCASMQRQSQIVQRKHSSATHLVP